MASAAGGVEIEEVARIEGAFEFRAEIKPTGPVLTAYLNGKAKVGPAGVDLLTLDVEGLDRPTASSTVTAFSRIWAAVKERFLAMGAEPSPTSPDKAREFIAAESARWAKIIKAAGITAN